MKKRLEKIRNFLIKGYRKASGKTAVFSRKILHYIDKKPLRSFFIALGIVLALIIIGNFIPKAKVVTNSEKVIKQVEVYHIGTAPKITVQAQVKKSGVIQIVAQTGGIINMIHAFEGTKIKKGSRLINIASNYYGGNEASIARQIAQKQDESVQATYQTQKEDIQKQKELAQKEDDNSDQLRDIISKTNDETNMLANLNQQIINTLDQSINSHPGTTAADEETRTKAGFVAALYQAREKIRNADYQAAGDKPLTKISDLTRESALKQLEVKEKQLDINKEISHLSLLLAQVREGVYYPSSPFSGTVERVFVKPFDSVTPGTPLMIISQNAEEDPITAVAFVSKDIATRASRLEPSILHIGDTAIAVQPSFISTEAVQGSLYAIYFPIPDSYNKKLTNEGYINIELPVGYPDTLSSAPFIPIDAVYQTRSSAYIFVADSGVAKSKEIKLGQVMGSFVEVESGLNGNDSVILNRNVIDGDSIQTN